MAPEIIYLLHEDVDKSNPRKNKKSSKKYFVDLTKHFKDNINTPNKYVIIDKVGDVFIYMGLGYSTPDKTIVTEFVFTNDDKEPLLFVTVLPFLDKNTPAIKGTVKKQNEKLIFASDMYIELCETANWKFLFSDAGHTPASRKLWKRFLKSKKVKLYRFDEDTKKSKRIINEEEFDACYNTPNAKRIRLYIERIINE